MSSVIHMETEQIYELGQKIMNMATEYISQVGQLRYSAGDLRQAWVSPRATLFSQDFGKLIENLQTQALVLDTLGKRLMREVDEWVDADRVESAYVSAVKDSFSISGREILGLGSAWYLPSHLGSSSARPNSMIFTGPNWMRKLLGIKEATRVIQPANLAKGMAWAGLLVSAGDAWGVIQEDIVNMHYEGPSRIISAATVDGATKFAISAVGTVGIPLLLGTIVTAVGLPVLAGGATVLAGTVILGFAYTKLVEAPAWQMWKESTTRQEFVETGARWVNQASNFLNHLKDQVVNQINNVFQPSIQNVANSPAPA